MPLRALVLVSAFVVVVAACSGAAASPTAPAPGTATAAPASPVTSPASAAPSSAVSVAPSQATTGRIEVPEHGYGLTLPDGWKRIPLDQTSLDAFVAQLPPDSDIARILSSQAGQMATSGISLWAMDLSTDAILSGFAPNANIIVQPSSGLTLDTLKAVAQGQLQNVSAISDVQVADVTLPAGPAVKATYALNQATTSGTTITVSGTQYYVIGTTNLYIVSLSCGGSDASVCSADFDALIQSLAITG
jgi:hypothetical protein